MDLGELVGHIVVKDDYKKSLGEAKRDFSTVGDSLDEGVAKTSSKLAKTGAVLGAIGGTAVAGGLAIGFANSLTTEAAEKKLEAQLGGASQLSKDAGAVAGSLYANAYGTSLEEVNEAVRSVVSSGALMEDASTEQIENITARALSLRDAFGVDVAESMRAVGQLVRTEMVPDAEAGLDLITVAFQQLGPQAGDVLDTFSEYSTQFRKIGIDGAQALGMVNQMVQAGARDTDVAADALKEFAIRSVDGSKLTVEGFTAIGLNADEMSRKFAMGGETASAAFTQTINALKNMSDPLARETASVALFGTQAEDLGAALFAIDPATAVKGLGDFTGAAAELDATIGDTAQARLTSMQRGFENFLGSIVSAPGILGTAGTAIALFGEQGLAMAGSAAMIATALPASWATAAMGVVSSIGTMLVALATWVATQIASAATAIASAIATSIAYIGTWIAMAAAAMVNAAIMAAAWIIALGPIGWVIAAIVALVALIILNWDTVKNATVAAWNAVSGAVTAAINFVKNIVMAGLKFIMDLFFKFHPVGIIIKHWDDIVRVISNGVQAAIGFVQSLPGKIMEVFAGAGRWLWDVGKRIIQGLIDGIMAMFGAVGNAISSIVSHIRNALPFSPAKWGPLAGSGSPEIAGQIIGEMLARGIRRSIADVSDATIAVTAATRVPTELGPAGGATSGFPDIREFEDALRRAVSMAMNRARLLVEGAGTARLVNTVNQLDARRMGGFSGSA